MYQQQQPQGPVNVRELTDQVAGRLEDLKEQLSDFTHASDIEVD